MTEQLYLENEFIERALMFNKSGDGLLQDFIFFNIKTGQNKS